MTASTFQHEVGSVAVARPLVPVAPVERLQAVLDTAWHIFLSRFVHGRHPVTKEAPFQHHLANIISTVGSLYCIEREDLFLVDLETKEEDVRGRAKYLDITCSFVNHRVSCAIELKFKTARMAAQDYGRIDAYGDIEALELICARGYDFGRFYMVTDSTAYVNPSSRGVGTVFAMHHGHESPVGKPLACPESKGREGVEVCLRSSYRFNWERHGPWHFLALHIDPSR
jgi:hypothetical protein